MIPEPNNVEKIMREDNDTMRRLLFGEWVDSKLVERALGLTFAECMKHFELARTASWNRPPENGQRIETLFRLRVPPIPPMTANAGTTLPMGMRPCGGGWEYCSGQCTVCPKLQNHHTSTTGGTVKMDERNLVAVSIKHTIHGWKFGMPCWLWGSRTNDEEKRSFRGYTEYPNNAEVYSLKEWQESGYGDGDVCKVDEPVQMCIGFCKKYKQYDTVLVPLDEYITYCNAACLPIDKPKRSDA